jgi:hypothetical protein
MKVVNKELADWLLSFFDAQAYFSLTLLVAVLENS